MKKTQQFNADCPECGVCIHLENKPRLYQLLLCPHCEALLIVKTVLPPQLDWAFEEPTEPDDPFTPHFPGPPSVWQWRHRR